MQNLLKLVEIWFGVGVVYVLWAIIGLYTFNSDNFERQYTYNVKPLSIKTFKVIITVCLLIAIPIAPPFLAIDIFKYILNKVNKG